MTIAAAHVRVLNSLLFIQDANTKDVPTIDGNGSIWKTATCVAVSCMPDCDGITEVDLGASSDIEKASEKLVFDGFLETPSRKIHVTTVLGQTILEKDVSGTITHVCIWTNGLRDTDRVVIGLG